MKKTWSTLHQFALAHRSGPQESASAGGEVTEEDMEAVAEKLSKEELERKEKEALVDREQGEETGFVGKGLRYEMHFNKTGNKSHRLILRYGQLKLA